MRRVVVVGSAGQDGRILCERLRGEGSSVTGIAHGSLDCGDGREHAPVHISNSEEVAALVSEFLPGEIYYLAAYHHSSQENVSCGPLDLFRRSAEVHVSGLLNFLEAIRTLSPSTRLFYASSSLIFGEPPSEVQDEKTPFNPRCVYGITKTTGIHSCRYYREAFGVHASAGILYNHESAYRQEKFLSQKIIRAALRIHRGEQEKLTVGDLAARADWGYAPDYVDAMIRIVAAERPDDFVIATGETHSVREFVEVAFGLLGLAWEKHVQEDPTLLIRRKQPMRGNASKLQALTQWRPSMGFEMMIETILNAQRDAG